MCTRDGTPRSLGRVREQLRAALAGAMKEKDAVAVAALRSALAAIANAEAVPAGEATGSTAAAQSETIAGAVVGLRASELDRRRLTGHEVADLVRAEIAERRAAADLFDGAGQRARAARLRAEADVLSRHLRDG